MMRPHQRDTKLVWMKTFPRKWCSAMHMETGAFTALKGMTTGISHQGDDWALVCPV